MRKDECLITRPDMLSHVKEGLVPRWMRDIPVEHCISLLRLKDEGFGLLGLDPADDMDDP